MSEKAVMENVRAVTPYMVCKDTPKALDWYKENLGAQIIRCHYGEPETPFAGKVMHASIMIGEGKKPSILFLCDEFPDMGNKSPEALGGTPVSLYLYTDNCDALFDKCCSNGAAPLQKPCDQFWGDRWSLIRDPFGHIWHICTMNEVVSEEEMTKRRKAMAATGGAA